MYFFVDILCKISLAKISTFDSFFFTFSYNLSLHVVTDDYTTVRLQPS